MENGVGSGRWRRKGGKGEGEMEGRGEMEARDEIEGRWRGGEMEGRWGGDGR